MVIIVSTFLWLVIIEGKRKIPYGTITEYSSCCKATLGALLEIKFMWFKSIRVVSISN